MAYQRKTSEINNHFHMVPGGKSERQHVENYVERGAVWITVNGKVTVTFEKTFDVAPWVLITPLKADSTTGRAFVCWLYEVTTTDMQIEGRNIIDSGVGATDVSNTSGMKVFYEVREL